MKNLKLPSSKDIIFLLALSLIVPLIAAFFQDENAFWETFINLFVGLWAFVSSLTVWLLIAEKYGVPPLISILIYFSLAPLIVSLF
ncbi:MAG: hypothetical protein CMF31_00010 [Kordiimonas sp.]|nr:hypothetical protein [Kordiimonas sp.]|tara:strand:- start:272 stop:529 length:258 start_codon:yes stop_codon:yes gene_type:complete